MIIQTVNGDAEGGPGKPVRNSFSQFSATFTWMAQTTHFRIQMEETTYKRVKVHISDKLTFAK